MIDTTRGGVVYTITSLRQVRAKTLTPGTLACCSANLGDKRLSGDYNRTCGPDGWQGDPLVCEADPRALCTLKTVTAFTAKVEDGTPVFANASGGLSKAPYPNDRVLNCTRLVDVTCQGWHVTFVPSVIDLTDGIDFLHVYDGDTLDPEKRIAVFATGDPNPYDGFSGTRRTNWISATTSQSKMTLQFITSGEGYKTNAQNYGFAGLYFTGTYSYVQCVLDNIDNFEVCQIAGNGITEGTEECDDGNFIDGDGCSRDMKIEVTLCDIELEFQYQPLS